MFVIQNLELAGKGNDKEYFSCTNNAFFGLYMKMEKHFKLLVITTISFYTAAIL